MERSSIGSWAQLVASAIAATGVVLVATAVPAPAQTRPVGGQFQVNTYTTGYQTLPSVAADADGDFVVVWGSNGIKGQRYASNGTPLGGEFQVSSGGVGGVAAEANGDFVVVWSGYDYSGTDTSGSSIHGQRYASDGTALGAKFQVNTDTTYDQSFVGRTAPHVAADADGDFVVVWRSGYFGDSVRGQRYASDGTALGGEFQVNTCTVCYADAGGGDSVAADADGDFVVVWASIGSPGTDTSSESVQGQRYASDGTALGGQFQVNTYYYCVIS